MYNRHTNFNDKLKRVIERVAENIQTQHDLSNSVGRNHRNNVNRVGRIRPVSTVFEDNQIDDDEEDESQE